MNSISNRGDCGADASQSRLVSLIGAPSTAQNLGDLLIWPQSENASDKFYFLPLAPTINLTPDGLPNVGLMDHGGLGFFYATLQLSVDVERLELLRRDLATEDNHVPHLSPAALTVKTAQVVMIDASGNEAVLYERTPAPNPPYTAMLQFTAPQEAKPAILAALMGHTNNIVLRYEIERQSTIETQYTLQGIFPETLSISAIEEAINQGTLTLEPMPETPEIRHAVLDIADWNDIQRTAQANHDALQVVLSISDTHSFEISADLGRIVERNSPINDPLPPE